MNIKCKMVGVFFLVGLCLAISSISFPQTANAITTPNVLMGFDPMVALHTGTTSGEPGLFRGGANTFQFNSFYDAPSLYTGVGTAYDSFLFSEITDGSGGGLSHNARSHHDTPETWNGTQYSPVINQDLDNDFLPLIDRSAFGQVFDPNQYEIEVRYRPVMSFPSNHPLYNPLGDLIQNQAETWGVSLDQLDGFVADAQNGGTHKRAGEQIGYGIGTRARPINTIYTDPNTPKDSEGYMTVKINLNAPTFAQRSFYYLFGDNPFRDLHALAGDGRVQDPNGVWIDDTDGLDPLSYEDDLSAFDVPQGVPVIGLGSSFDPNQDDQDVYIEIKHILLKKKIPDPTLVARMDSASGFTHRFGTSLNYSNTLQDPTPINVLGTNYQPIATNEVSRFDENGLTNLVINPHAPEDPNNTGYQLLLRSPPSATTFDGTEAVVNFRLKLTEPIGPGDTSSVRVVLKDLDKTAGVTSEEQAAEEYYFDFNLSTLDDNPNLPFVTLTQPVSAFTLDSPGPGTDGIPDGFDVDGDEDRSDFNMYEMTLMVLDGGGLLHAEIEYLEVRLPSACAAGDFDCNGFVDGRDLLSWQRGETTPVLSQAALNDWATNYGTQPLMAAAAAVPEPSTVLLAVCGLALVGRRRKSA